jgi:hypothetical protein
MAKPRKQARINRSKPRTTRTRTTRPRIVKQKGGESAPSARPGPTRSNAPGAFSRTVKPGLEPG